MESRTWARSGPKSYKVATHNKTCVYDFFMFKTQVRSDNEQPLEHVHTHGVTQLRGSCCNMAKTTNHDQNQTKHVFQQNICFNKPCVSTKHVSLVLLPLAKHQQACAKCRCPGPISAMRSSNTEKRSRAEAC